MFYLVILTVIVCVSGFSDQLALGKEKRIAAYKRLSSKLDDPSEKLAGHYIMRESEENLKEVAEVQGMRSVYNIIETPNVIESWQDHQILK